MSPKPDTPMFAVSDGAHHGNPDFFFLPPLFKNPIADTNYEANAANMSLKPAVEICELGTAADGSRECIAGPARKRFDPSAVTANVTEQFYQVNWNTAETALDPAKYYRIRVLVGSSLLGFADVDPVTNGSQLKNVQTNEYIGLVDGRTLPIRFRIETGALCEVDGTPCASGTINLSQGGGVELLGAGEDFHVDIPSGTTASFDGQPVTSVTLNLEVCPGIDVDLPTFGPCLRVSTFSDATGQGELQFSKPVLISMCVLNSVYHTPDETPQEDLITLHQQDGTLIRALPHAAPDCNVIGSRSSGWDWLKSLAARILAPQSAYAATRSAVLHVGAGGQTSVTGSTCTPSSPSAVQRTLPAGITMTTTCPPSSPIERSSGLPRAQGSVMAAITPPLTVSDFQFALPAKMDYVYRDPNTGIAPDSDRTAPSGTILPTGVKVTDWHNDSVPGATVRFIDGIDTVGVAKSDIHGIAQIPWTIHAGSNAVVATGRGIAAKNNLLNPNDPVRPFMPDISVGDTVPRALGTGKITFNATGTQFGTLSFVQQPTNTPSGLAITPAIQISVRDPAGNPVSDPVEVVVGNDPSNPPECVVLQTRTLALSGVAVLDNVRVNGMCTGARLVVAAGGGAYQYHNISSNTFDITAPPVSLTVNFTQGTDVALDGSVPYVATVTNNGSSLAGVFVQAYIDQGSTTRAAGGELMHNCSATSGDGELPPGPCSINRVLVASNQNAGTGTLSAGPATARITVQWNGGTIIAQQSVAVNIVIPPPTGTPARD